MPIPKNSKIEALKALGGTLNFIDFWLKMFYHNYEEGSMIYHEAMKKLFKKYQQ